MQCWARRRAALALIAILAEVNAAGAAGQSQSNRFGVIGGEKWPQTLDYASDLSAGWIRLNCPLGDSGPDITSFLEAGFNLVITISNNDPSNSNTRYGTLSEWPSAGFPFISKTAYQARIRSLLAPLVSYLSSGRQIWVQCENEICDASVIFKAKYWRGTTAQYLLQLDALYECVRSVSPSMPVVLSSFASETLDALIAPDDPRHNEANAFANQLLSEGRYDAADLHFYGCVDAIADKIRWLQGHMAGDKRWISTENGGPDSRCPSTPISWTDNPTAFEQLQAQQVPVRLSACAGNGGAVCLYYSLYDLVHEADVFVHLGLLDIRTNPPRKKPAYDAFRTLTSSLSANYYFSRLRGASGGSGNNREYTGLAVANLDSSPAQLRFTTYDKNGSLIAGNGITNPKSILLNGGEQLALMDTEVFGNGISAWSGSSWAKLNANVTRLAAFFLLFDGNLTVLDGADARSTLATSYVLPDIEQGGLTEIHVVNPGSDSAAVRFELWNAQGSRKAAATRNINPGGEVDENVESLFPGFLASSSDYLRVTSDKGVAVFEYLSKIGRYTRALNGLDGTQGAATLYCPQYAVGGGYRSAISVVNLSSNPAAVTLRWFEDGGISLSVRQLTIPANGKLYISEPDYFGGLGGSSTRSGYVEIASDGANLAGSIAFSDEAQNNFSSALPLVSSLMQDFAFGHIASDATYFTGISLLNPSGEDSTVAITVCDKKGNPIATRNDALKAKSRLTKLFTELFPQFAGQPVQGGYIKVAASKGVAGFALFGTNQLSALSAIPAQAIAR